MLKEIKSEEICNLIYPLTIVVDRYGGTYSGGMYTAWHCYPDEIPLDISETDVTCKKFWDEFLQYKNLALHKVGIGNTILEAVFNLFVELKEKEWGSNGDIYN